MTLSVVFPGSLPSPAWAGLGSCVNPECHRAVVFWPLNPTSLLQLAVLVVLKSLAPEILSTVSGASAFLGKTQIYHQPDRVTLADPFILQGLQMIMLTASVSQPGKLLRLQLL